LPAMIVNDNACGPGKKRGVLESIAGKPAPTVLREVRSAPTGSWVRLICQSIWPEWVLYSLLRLGKIPSSFFAR
jgi:hypothetical protein